VALGATQLELCWLVVRAVRLALSRLVLRGRTALSPRQVVEVALLWGLQEHRINNSLQVLLAWRARTARRKLVRRVSFFWRAKNCDKNCDKNYAKNCDEASE
jgi:hypothetical protein